MYTTEQANKVIRILKRHYPQKPDMDLGNPDDSLIATILSARTTDAQVLKLFPSFRKKFPTWKKLASADLKSIEQSLNTIGMYRNKAKSLKALAQKLIKEFNSQVPSTMDQLVTLPGVGRKTASCVLSYCFKQPAVAVDTHVFRISHRLGWSQGKNPEDVERDIKNLLPKNKWSDVNRTFIHFGRDICTGSTKPKCWLCPLHELCKYPEKTKEIRI